MVLESLIALIGSLVTGICAIIGNIIISKRNVQEMYAKLDKQSELNDQKLDAKIQKWQAVTDTKIEELTREVREHNNFARRMPVVEEQIKVVNHRLDDLEEVTKR